jgi:5-methylcytosine-specific restriction endonuclease McrA
MKHKYVPVRIDEEMLDTIDRYAILHGIDRSKAIRELLRFGLVNRANIEMREKFSEMLTVKWLAIQEKTTKLINEGKNLILVRDNFTCQKCHSNSKLTVYHINRDPLNSNPSNLITLCEDCISRAEKYTPKRRVIEDFLEWFYLL